MNPIDDQLNRLIRAAAKSEASLTPSAPYGLETRILSAWRTGRSSATGFWEIGLLMRGLILASLIMVVSFVPALKNASDHTANPFADFLQLTDSTVPSDETP